MHEERIIELITRKIAGEATAEELDELSYLLTKSPDAVYYEALLEQVWEMSRNDGIPDFDEVFNKHKIKYKDDLDFRSITKFTFFKRLAFVLTIASCIILLITTHFVKNYIPVANGNFIEVIAG